MGYLSEEHRRQLVEESGIAEEVVAERGYETVTVKAEMGRRGFSVAQRRVPTLLMPIHGVTGGIVNYHSRPDVPRINNHGKPVKYELPSGSKMVLDVPPRARPYIGDPSVPLFVTEGIKKADALASRDACAVGLLGVWNFRGTNAQGGKTALGEWESIALNDRQVYVVYDSDVMTKKEVHAALTRLAAFLRTRKAKLAFIYLPSGPGGVKQGADDFLAAGHSLDDLLALADTELRQPEGDGSDETKVYEATDRGLVWNKLTADGDTVRTPLSNFTARIVADTHADDGAETMRRFDLVANVGGDELNCSVPATEFERLDWVLPQLGPQAIIESGYGLRDRVRQAIQACSGDVARRRVYTHTGWREVVKEFVYLHGGGAIGSETAGPDVLVELGNGLDGFVLPPPPTGAALTAAVRASLRMLDLAPDPVAVPLVAAIWRAPLGQVNFSLHLVGETGAKKTAIATLAQQHWGPRLEGDGVPGNWISTANATEALAFVTKDALLVVDDLVPTGSIYDVQRVHRDADRVFRAQGNRSGRRRLRTDGTLRPVKPPRGLIVSTGEEVPAGASLQARLLILKMAKTDVAVDVLTDCQRDARAGLYAAAMAGYLRDLAPRYAQVAAALQDELHELRAAATRPGQHARTPEIAAQLAIGIRSFLEFAVSAAAITSGEQELLWRRCWEASIQQAARQGAFQHAADPARRYVELLAAAVAMGEAYVVTIDGGEPADAAAWGWQDSRLNGRQPRGAQVGWLDGTDLYVDPDAAFAAVQRVAQAEGDPMRFSRQTVQQRLADAGLVLSRDKDHIDTKKTVQGRRRRVLHLSADALGTLVAEGEAALESPDGTELAF